MFLRYIMCQQLGTKPKSLSAGHIRGQSISSLKVNDKQEGRYETLMVSFDQHKYRNSHSASIVFWFFLKSFVVLVNHSSGYRKVYLSPLLSSSSYNRDFFYCENMSVIWINIYDYFFKFDKYMSWYFISVIRLSDN